MPKENSYYFAVQRLIRYFKKPTEVSIDTTGTEPVSNGDVGVHEIGIENEAPGEFAELQRVEKGRIVSAIWDSVQEIPIEYSLTAEQKRAYLILAQISIGILKSTNPVSEFLRDNGNPHALGLYKTPDSSLYAGIAIERPKNRYTGWADPANISLNAVKILLIEPGSSPEWAVVMAPNVTYSTEKHALWTQSVHARHATGILGNSYRGYFPDVSPDRIEKLTEMLSSVQSVPQQEFLYAAGVQVASADTMFKTNSSRMYDAIRNIITAGETNPIGESFTDLRREMMKQAHPHMYSMR